MTSPAIGTHRRRPVTFPVDRRRRPPLGSVGQKRHLDPGVAVEQHRTRERLRSNRSRIVEHVVECAPARTAEGEFELTAVSSSRLATVMPISVMPARRSSASRRPAGSSGRPGWWPCARSTGRVCERVIRAKSSKPEPQDHRPADPSASRSTGDAIHEADQRDVEIARPRSGGGRGRVASRSIADAARVVPPRVAVVGQRVEMTTGRGTEHRTAPPPDSRDLGHGVMPRSCNWRPSSGRLPRGTRPGASAGSELVFGRRPPGGRRAWRPRSHLGEELGPGHADGDHEARPGPDLFPQANGDLGRGARDPA